MTVALLTAGSRGDVQPFLALALGLQRAGHQVVLAAPSDARSFVAAHDVPFVSLGVDFQALATSPEGRGALAGNPLDLARIVRRAQSITREMIETGGRVALDADVAVCHPKTLVAPHVAEASGHPVFLAASMPVIAPTRAFPIPMGVFPDLGPLNPATYLLSRLGMLPYRRAIKEWRTGTLGLAPSPWWSDPFAVHGQPLPVLYAFSPTIVSPQPNWPPSVHVTGTSTLPEDAAPNAADRSGYGDPSGKADASGSRETGSDLPADVQRFLDAGEAPV